jgi:hypothetical protein
MALRGPEAMEYLRLKASFQPSDCNAVYSDGWRLPVLIRSIGGSNQFAVEISDQLFEAAKVSGFQGYEKIPEPPAPEPPAHVQKADNWTPPPRLAVPGSKSTAQDERWQPRFQKLNLERVQKGCLFAEKCLGRNYDSKEKYYRCRCVSCGKTVQATQSDLLLGRIRNCSAHE